MGGWSSCTRLGGREISHLFSRMAHVLKKKMKADLAKYDITLPPVPQGRPNEMNDTIQMME